MWLAFALALFVPRAVSAQPDASAATPAAPESPDRDKLARAKELFDAGAREYEAGRFEAALQAFEQAYRVVPRDGIMFSMAQAHRRQYTRDRDKKHLIAAVELFKQYIDKVKSGGRVADAVRALGELEPLMVGVVVDATPPPAEPRKTRIVINIVAAGTKASIDGGPAKDTPLNEEVQPGKHTVKLSAPGYFDEERTLEVGEGEIAPANLPQRERPAQLSLLVAGGADISIDGRYVGESPLSRPVELPSGKHAITVLKNGYRAYAAEIAVVRGQSRTLDVELDSTTQRTISYIVLASAGALGIVGASLGAYALARQSDAIDILDAREERALIYDEVFRYEAARSERDFFAALGLGFGGGGAVLAIVGVGLLVFDKPPPPVTGASVDGPSSPSPGPQPDVELTPSVSFDAQGWSIGVQGSFL